MADNNTSKVTVLFEGDSKKLEQAVDKANKSLASFERKTSKANSSKSGLGGMLATAKKLAPAIGAAFAVEKLASFTKESVLLASKLEGIERTFKRIELSGVTSLEALKEATMGAVSEFDLMQKAVMASNFKLPLANLADFFRFATIRAQQTGESVDYLVNSIVLGIGRKSPLILDNLGITLVRLKEAMGKVGRESATVAEISAAVAKIAREETEILELLGKTSKTTGQEIATLASAWKDFKTEFGKGLTGEAEGGSKWLSDALSDAKAVMEMGEKQGKSGGAFAGMTAFVESLLGIEGKGDEAIEFLKKYRLESERFAREMDAMLPSIEGMREALTDKDFEQASRILNSLNVTGRITKEQFDGLGDALLRVKEKVTELEKVESKALQEEEDRANKRNDFIEKYLLQLEKVKISQEEGFITVNQRAQQENAILQRAIIDMTQDVENLGLAATDTYTKWNDLLRENNQLLNGNAGAIEKAREAFEARQMVLKYRYNSDAAAFQDPLFGINEDPEETPEDEQGAIDELNKSLDEQMEKLRDISQMWSALSNSLGQVAGLFNGDNGISQTIQKVAKLGQVFAAVAAAKAAFMSLSDPSAAARAIGAATAVATAIGGLLGSFGVGSGGVSGGGANLNNLSGQRLYTEISGRDLRIVMDRDSAFSNRRG